MTYRGLCFGGPKHKEWVESSYDRFEFAWPHNLKFKSLVEDTDPLSLYMSYGRGTYSFERAYIGGRPVGFWIVSSPKEHYELWKNELEKAFEIFNLIFESWEKA